MYSLVLVVLPYYLDITPTTYYHYIQWYPPHSAKHFGSFSSVADQKSSNISNTTTKQPNPTPFSPSISNNESYHFTRSRGSSSRHGSSGCHRRQYQQHPQRSKFAMEPSSGLERRLHLRARLPRLIDLRLLSGAFQGVLGMLGQDC